MKVRFEGLAGEFSQHDFGHVDVRFLDGRKERAHFFASRLKYSRWVQVTLVENEQVEALVRAMVEHFAAWGGLPLLAVFDRPKSIALKWTKDGTVTEWNPTFGAVMLDLGLGVELCWPRSPEQKGAVENLVGWVKGSFFKQRRFVDDEDVLRQLVEWHDEVNAKRPSRATRVIPAVRLSDERLRLRLSCNRPSPEREMSHFSNAPPRAFVRILDGRPALRTRSDSSTHGTKIADARMNPGEDPPRAERILPAIGRRLVRASLAPGQREGLARAGSLT